MKNAYKVSLKFSFCTYDILGITTA